LAGFDPKLYRTKKPAARATVWTHFISIFEIKGAEQVFLRDI
jgi:hypothetical protein